jgi:hypothetical protein
MVIEHHPTDNRVWQNLYLKGLNHILGGKEKQTHRNDVRRWVTWDQTLDLVKFNAISKSH